MDYIPMRFSVYSLGGLILDFAVGNYNGIAVFQPVINGECDLQYLLTIWLKCPLIVPTFVHAQDINNGTIIINL